MKKPSTTAIDELLLEYQKHLIQTAGHRPATCKAWSFYARKFLRDQFRPRARLLDWDQIQALSLLRYFSRQQGAYGPFRLKLMATALRSFCRFLRLQNYCRHDWSAGIPRISAGVRQSLRIYLTQAQLAQLVKGPSGGPNSRRDYALMVCLAKLGLRAAEVAQLALEDLHWSEGVLSLARSKGRQARRLPLPEAVGQALAAYLRMERPACSQRRVFLSLQTKRPLSPNSVSNVVRKHLKRLGLPLGGAHLLRRTVASHLVQNQASIKEVADLLGHKSLTTTTVYTQVNLPMLQQVIMPWPQEAAR